MKCFLCFIIFALVIIAIVAITSHIFLFGTKPKDTPHPTETLTCGQFK